MKDRIVIWGQNEKEEDILIAIRLLQDSDIIKIWTFPKKDTNTEFVDQLFQEWKDGAENAFPQPHQLIERGISEENMLPESIKTPKTDVIKIAEQEWRVRVLSFRLYQHIKQQIEQLDTRAINLSIFSKDVWEEAKDVSKSIKENTLDRNIKKRQTTELRNSLDAVFDKLKKLQNAEQEKFLGVSKGHLGDFREKISEVAEQIGKGNTGKKLFDQLIKYQQEVKGLDMTIRDRNALRTNFNEAFEALKASRQSNFGNRMNARVNGLKSAIGKMEASIKRDKDNVNYQSGRINKNNTTQLEYQLRSAKLTLIEDRIHSKEQKLHNMYLTLKDLEKKAGKAAAKAQKGVLAATTNNKKAQTKDSKATETKSEASKNESAKTETQKDAGASEATPAQVANVKEEAPGQVAHKQEETATPAPEASKSEKVDAVEPDKVTGQVEASLADQTKAVESIATSTNETKAEVETATDKKESNNEIVDNAVTDKKEMVTEVSATKEDSKAEGAASDSESTSNPVSKAGDAITEKAGNTVAGIAASAAAVAGGLGLTAATGSGNTEQSATENKPDASTAETKEHVETSVESPAIETEVKEQAIDQADENITEVTKKEDTSNDSETSKVDDSGSMVNPISKIADTITEKAGNTVAGIAASAAAVAGGLGLTAASGGPNTESSTTENLPDVPTTAETKEHLETSVESLAAETEVTKKEDTSNDSDSTVNPVSKIGDTITEKAGDAVAGIAASAAAVAGGLGLSAATGSANTEPSATENLPDVPTTVSEAKESIETTIESPALESDVKEQAIDQVAENITDVTKEEE